MAPGTHPEPAARRRREAGGEAARDDRAGGDGSRAAHSLTEADSRAEFAPAKVNLFLHVTGRRADGYHTLDSLAVFACIGDFVQAEPAAALSLTIAGPFAEALSPGSSNLVLGAAQALGRAASIRAGAAIRLVKNLPVASGIGGGSADAAATLRLLARMWEVSPVAIDLPAVALKLGADVPVCLAGCAARMGGIGERIEPAPRLPPFGLLLVNPGRAVATADVFRARRAPFSAPAVLPQAWPSAECMAAEIAGLRNDLDQPAIALCPIIAEVLAAIAGLPGCLLARMSGSGSTCFGLFRTASDAMIAAKQIERPDWWCWGGAPA